MAHTTSSTRKTTETISSRKLSVRIVARLDNRFIQKNPFGRFHSPRFTLRAKSFVFAHAHIMRPIM